MSLFIASVRLIILATHRGLLVERNNNERQPFMSPVAGRIRPGRREEMLMKSNDKDRIEAELLDTEIEQVHRAIVRRNSHLHSVDRLTRAGERPKRKSNCPTPWKQTFTSKRDADRVLHRIENQRREAQESGMPFRFMANRTYKCQAGRHYHHSSKAEHASMEVFNVA